ncbi:MAG: hypothetical protein ACK4E3_03725 [Brevundimonas sp.]|uniref:hypothetical protein n=1 Tax=Brevundimonas sp. TaxID=1871086 RepID=UPI003919B3C0
MSRPSPLSPEDRARILRRGAGVFAFILGVSFLANSAVMLMGGRGRLSDELLYIVPGLILLGLGLWLWRQRSS